MSIFNNNITTEIPFEAIIQSKYSQAIRKAAALCWAQNCTEHGSFEHMARWMMCDELEPMLFCHKKYKFLHEDTNFKYESKGDKRERVWVITSIFFEDKKTHENIGFDLSESVLIKF